MATALQFVDGITVDSPRESASAKMMARFYFASFWMIIFTGAIRKWMFPGVSAFYLLQDVPLGLAYAYALWSGFYDRGYMLLSIIFMSAVLVLQGLAQIMISGLDIFVAVVGFHNYLFYLPILVVFPLALTEKYRRDFVWWNMMLSLPMSLLAVAQALSSKQAWVNRTSEGEAFGLPGADVARVSGTFNFTVFYGVWVGIAVAFCMGEWLVPKERRVIKNQWVMIACTFAVNICHLVSASRSAIALAAMAILGSLVGAVILGAKRAILAIVGICVLLPLAAGATFLISPAEFNIVVDRFTGERGQEDFKSRVGDGLIGFATIPEFSFVGAGIGMGVDASHVGNAETYNFTYTLSEGDIIRNVMELGTPVGLFYVLTRISFLFGMVFLSIRMLRAGNTPHALPLSFCLLAQAYQGDLTRAATMTASQVMVGYAFILGAYFYPDQTPSLGSPAGDFLTRSV